MVNCGKGSKIFLRTAKASSDFLAKYLYFCALKYRFNLCVYTAKD
jgi:hypothetical protein